MDIGDMNKITSLLRCADCFWWKRWRVFNGMSVAVRLSQKPSFL